MHFSSQKKADGVQTPKWTVSHHRMFDLIIAHQDLLECTFEAFMHVNAWLQDSTPIRFRRQRCKVRFRAEVITIENEVLQPDSCCKEYQQSMMIV